MCRFFFLMCVLCAAISPCLAVSETEAKEREAFYKWFASLKYPEAEKLPFVRLHLPAYSPQSHRDIIRTDYAFLLKQSKKSIEIFHPNLFNQELLLNQEYGNKNTKNAYEIISIADTAKEYLKAIQNRDQTLWIMSYRIRDYTGNIEIAIMSYYFHKAGLEKEAIEAYHLWKTSPSFATVEGLARQIAFQEAARITDDLKGDSFVPTLPSWESLLQRSEAIVRRFGSSTSVDNEILKYIPLIERNVREEQEHNREQHKTFEQMSQIEKIKELVYQLRDQNGSQVMNHEAPNIYGPFMPPDYNPDGRTPAHQLRKIGLPALPYLAEASDDDRLSRTKDGWNGIWRVSQVVSTLISDITGGKRFSLDLPKNLAPTEYKRRKQVAIKEWLQKIEKICSVEGLRKRVRNGDRWAADLLLERNNSKALLEPLKYGILHAKDELEKTYLLQLCSKLPRFEMVPFLKERVEQEKSLGARVAAIRELGEFEKARALKYMLKECRQSRREANESMVSYLIASGDAEALKAVERHLSAFNQFWLSSHLGDIASTSCDNSKGNTGSSQNVAYRKVAEKILVKFLNDTRQDTSGGSYGDYTFHNPRTCDLVAIYLNTMDKKKYPIRYPLPVKELDKQRYRLINIWRKENGLSLLPKGQ